MLLITLIAVFDKVKGGCEEECVEIWAECISSCDDSAVCETKSIFRSKIEIRRHFPSVQNSKFGSKSKFYST